MQSKQLDLDSMACYKPYGLQAEASHLMRYVILMLRERRLVTPFKITTMSTDSLAGAPLVADQRALIP